MSDLPVEKMIQWAAERARTQAEFVFSNEEYGDTPIERSFQAALILMVQDYTFNLRRLERGARAVDTVASDYGHVAQERQTVHGGFRVDFAYKCTSCRGEVKWVIVECDGHEFHERTKEQAVRDRSRDRDLQLLGYTILRFTGREIWTDPIGCAQQAITAMSNIWMDGIEVYGDAK
jgi:very-short-patch-repair endonuclease